MAKYILGLSILILAVAAFLGYQTKEKVVLKVAELARTKDTLHSTEQKLAKTDAELKETNTKLTAANESIADYKTKLESTETMLAAAKTEAEKAMADAKEKEVLLAAKDKEIADLKAPPVPGVATENPAVKEAQEKVVAMTKERDEAKLASEQYQARQKAAEEKVAGLMATIEHYRKGVTQAGLTGSILHVNPGWNFVVIDVGDKQGVTVNSPLLVMRGNQRVATLKVTSVEPRQSIADVVPGSMVRGTMVQVGDRVVFAGSRGQGTTPPPPGAEAPLTPPATPQ